MSDSDAALEWRGDVSDVLVQGADLAGAGPGDLLIRDGLFVDPADVRPGARRVDAVEALEHRGEVAVRQARAAVEHVDRARLCPHLDLAVAVVQGVLDQRVERAVEVGARHDAVGSRAGRAHAAARGPVPARLGTARRIAEVDLLGWGVDALISDRPDLAVAAVAAR